MNRTRFASALAMVALAAILLPSSLRAMITFQRTYGGLQDDIGNSVQQTVDGGYIITGWTLSFGAGDYDIYLIKTDASGDTVWTRTFGGMSHDEGWWVQQTADKGYIITGLTDSYGAGSYDVYLVKTDPEGDTLWTRSYGGASYDCGYSVRQTTDGGYIIAGLTESFGAGDYDVYLIKTDENGDTMWTRTYGGTSEDYGRSVQPTVDGGYVVAGRTESFGAGNGDVYLIRTNANGDTLWIRTMGGTNPDEGYSVQQTADSGFIIVGYTESFGAGGCDVYLIKTNANGDTTWTRTYGGTLDDWGHSVQQTTDGGYIIAGYTRSLGTGNDVYLIRTDAYGDTLWTRTFGDTAWYEGYSVQQTRDDGYVVAGWTDSSGVGGWDVYLIKTDSLGNVGVAEPRTNPTRPRGLTLSCEPNPCRSSTVLHLTAEPLDHSTAALRIYDSQGRLVHSSFGIRASSFRLDLRSMPAGAYFIRCDAAGEHATARVVLQH